MLEAMNLPRRLGSGGGNSSAAAACRNGGHRNWTDADGNAFRNEGECVSYAARGGVLVPVATGPFSVSYSSIGSGVFRAVITGTGLEPSSMVRFSFVWPDRSVIAEFSIDASGNVTFTQDEQCRDANGDPMTSLTATGMPAGGSQTDYPLPVPDASICW